MMALLTDSKTALVVGIIVAGAFLGINNTVITEAVMGAAPVERPVASAAYSFVRFGGGAIAPYAAGKLGENVSVHAPFWMGAAAVAIAVVVLAAGRRFLEGDRAGRADSEEQAEAGRGRRRQLSGSAAAVGLEVGGAHLLRRLRGGHLVEPALERRHAGLVAGGGDARELLLVDLERHCSAPCSARSRAP